MVRVSVVVPTSDRQVMLEEALDSVLSQTWSDKEILVISNGSKPLGMNFISKFPSVKFFNIPPYSGPAVARNWGAMQAKGEFLSFLDDDDLWPPHFLEKMSLCADLEDADLIAAPIRHFDNEEEIIRPVAPDISGNLPKWWKNGFGGINIFVKRDIFWEVGGYTAWLITGEDRALAINFSLKGKKISVCNKTYALMREHKGCQLTDDSTLMLGKLCFLKAFGNQMPKRDLQEDRFAFLVYLSREWGWPLWILGCIYTPFAFWRRFKKHLLNKKLFK